MSRTAITKRCTKCQTEQLLDGFYRDAQTTDGRRSACKGCTNKHAALPENKQRSAAYHANWSLAPENQLKRAGHLLFCRYKLTLADFAELLVKQNGRCAVCGTDRPGGVGKFHVDHDHACCPGKKSCGKCVRGLLCHGCNIGIGVFGDEPERLESAAAYLRRHRACN